MSLGQKFYLTFGLLASLAVGLAAYGVFASGRTGTLVVHLFNQPLMQVNYARAATASLNEARGVMNSAVLLGPSPGAVARLEELHADIEEALQIVRQRDDDGSILNAIDAAGSSVSDWFNTGRLILAPPDNGITQLPMPAVLDRQIALAVGRLNDLVQLVAAQGYADRLRAEAEMRASAVTLAVLSGGIIVISGMFVVLFAQLLIRPILAAIGIAEAVAAGIPITVAASPRRDEIGRLLTSLGTMQLNLRSRDAEASALLQENVQATDALRRINLRFDTALNHMTHGLVMCDRDGSVVVVNRQFSDIYGIDPDHIHPGTSFREFVELSFAAGNYAGRTVDEVLAERLPQLQLHRPFTDIRTIAGSRTVAVSYEPMPDGAWVATHEDITERRKSEEQTVFLARHDALTKLPNRVLFQERLEQALAQAERGKGFALLCLDLDKFKAVNDTFGHPVGDGLLRAVANRLQDLVRGGDTVVRFGGDEFAILQAGVTEPAEAAALARRIVQTIGEPYEVDGNRVVVGTSVGIAVAPQDGSHATPLLRKADLALYRAKQDGRGRWNFFEPAMDALTEDRRALESDLRDAITLGQLELHYQPVINSRTRVVSGFEALLRWNHPARGLVLPGDFIPIAEELGVIAPIGAWVLQQACIEAAAWPQHLRVAINLSPLQFRSQFLVATVTEALRASNLEPKRLELEITESALLQNDSATLATLHAFRALGIRIAMDDFGTGYSSLSYLRSFPFDTIKIDRSFVTDLEARDECMAIVRAIVSLGSSLQMNITAEGVETEEQLALLVTAGCTELQGYLFSRPVPADALPALIERLSDPSPTAHSDRLIAVGA